ncbi:MAG: hypothetical protein PHY90_11125 [Desulfitobacteriaceae bacterium]|nr:hypothetical protein [Desulfitobacteriaceae bacterium]MDD4700576.1 hypothetical protein [Oscillospiraceae bacterium]
MTHLKIFLCIAINALWVIPFVLELIIHPIQDSFRSYKKNKEWKKENGYHLKKLCIHCSYCKWYYYHPFYKYGSYGNVCVSKMPSYCRKFRTPLKPDLSLRCISQMNESTEYEDYIEEK